MGKRVKSILKPTLEPVYTEGKKGYIFHSERKVSRIIESNNDYPHFRVEFEDGATLDLPTEKYCLFEGIMPEK